MKKLIFAASLVGFFFVSCSDSGDDNTYTPPATGNLLVKTIETDSEGTSVTGTYTYNGNKWAALTYTDGTHSTVNYTGDLITSIVYYDQDNQVEETDTFEYNAEGKLIAYYEDGTADFEIHNKFLYTYNTDGTIAVEHYNSSDGDTYVFLHDGVISDSKVTENVAAFDATPAHVAWDDFTYDDKNSPYLMITGFGKIIYAGDSDSKNFANNQTSQTHKNTLGLVQPFSTTLYTYNTANYPVTSVETEIDSDEDYTVEYFYQ
jgi:hypothetical protein